MRPSASSERAAQLQATRLALLFTPELCRHDPLETLEAVLPWIEMVQVRIKHPEDPTWPSPAAALYQWTERVLELVNGSSHGRVLVLVNDRVDVAASLVQRGVDGVHLGADDCPPAIARGELPGDALIGLSTHSTRDVVDAQEEPVNYLGFGPIHATATKGYSHGIGSETAWIIANATPLPVLPIGGIHRGNIEELAPVGRAAVSSAILAADDPASAARALRQELEPPPAGGFMSSIASP